MASRGLITALALGAGAAATFAVAKTSPKGFIAKAPAAGPIPSVESIKPLLNRGNYVFEAVLQQVGVVADSILPASDSTAVARVTRVFACPHEVGNFSTELVTLTEVGPHAPIGARSWYLGTGWSIGTTVATRVMRRVDGLDDSASLKFIDTLRAAVQLSYKESVQAAARASDSIVIATVGKTQNTMQDLFPPHTERPERWALLNLTLDSIRGFRDTSSNHSGQGVIGWLPPTDKTRSTAILVPYDVAYSILGKAQIVSGFRRLLFFERITRRPNLQRLAANAAGFISNADAIRPLSDAELLGATFAMPTFSLPPVSECPQTSR
jgi:hypothetical protein